MLFRSQPGTIRPWCAIRTGTEFASRISSRSGPACSVARIFPASRPGVCFFRNFDSALNANVGFTVGLIMSLRLWPRLTDATLIFWGGVADPISKFGGGVADPSLKWGEEWRTRLWNCGEKWLTQLWNGGAGGVAYPTLKWGGRSGGPNFQMEGGVADPTLKLWAGVADPTLKWGWGERGWWQTQPWNWGAERRMHCWKRKAKRNKNLRKR